MRYIDKMQPWLQHPLGQRLLSLQITPEKKLPHRQFLFRMLGKPCFPQGELVAVTGKAKSGKTFLCSALIVAAIRGECLGIRRQNTQSTSTLASSPTPGLDNGIENQDAGAASVNQRHKVLWIDTEQSEESTQDILVNRVIKQIRDAATKSSESGEKAVEAELNEMLTVLNLRSVNWDRRLELIEAAISIIWPQLIIFDGIRDVVSDINDGIGAQDVVERCMQLAGEYGACMVCVLHQNKAAEDKTLRGALGTELQNKCFETYECKKEDDRTFTVRQTSTRKYDILDALRFSVSEEGIPVTLSPLPNAEEPQEEGKRYKPLNGRYLDENRHFILSDIFRDAFTGQESMKFKELEKRVKDLTGIESYTVYNQVLANAIKSGIVDCQTTENGKVYRMGSC